MDRNHRMELQYDGTGLHGWAKQDGLLTVEGCLEQAFLTVLGAPPSLRVAGRTDAGVHARRQVASLPLPDSVDLYKLRRSLNALTPPQIAVLDLRRAPASFDARRDAVARTYRYFVCTDTVVSPFWDGYCWQVSGYDLDLSALAAAAAAAEGRHHFRAFTPTETEHVFFDRTVGRCRWTGIGDGSVPGIVLGAAPRAGRGRAAGMLCLEIQADAFLRHMVRALVGTMIELARGERTLKDFVGLLDGAGRESAGITAPPHGLFLWDIKYGRGGSKRRPPYGTIPGEAGGAAGGPFDDRAADSEA